MALCFSASCAYEEQDKSGGYSGYKTTELACKPYVARDGSVPTSSICWWVQGGYRGYSSCLVPTDGTCVPTCTHHVFKRPVQNKPSIGAGWRGVVPTVPTVPTVFSIFTERTAIAGDQLVPKSFTGWARGLWLATALAPICLGTVNRR